MKVGILLEFIGILMHSTTLLMKISDFLLRELVIKLFILSLVEFFFYIVGKVYKIHNLRNYIFSVYLACHYNLCSLPLNF